MFAASKKSDVSLQSDPQQHGSIAKGELESPPPYLRADVPKSVVVR